jgi:rhomboid protease GluP
MSAPDVSAEEANEHYPDDLVEAGVYPTFTAGSEHGLVVLAMEHPYWLVPFADRFRLLVEPRDFPAVREQLACFDRESIGWPPRPVMENPTTHPVEFATPLLWAFTVLVVFCGQGQRPAWLDVGDLDTEAVFARGEWWRPGTALFLHADLAHLLSNALSGIFVFSAVLSTIGLRRGWLLLALASVAGNLAAAALNYPGPYHSIGASTAIFAGLGLLTGRAIRVVARSGSFHRWRTMFVPLAAGLTVLGLYGAGGMHVDVLAHLMGFASGLGLGFIAALPRSADETGSRVENRKLSS